MVAAGHGLALVPAVVPAAPGVTLVPLRTPRLVHRTELIHATLPAGPTTTPADLLRR